MYRLGIVKQRDPATMRVTCTFPDRDDVESPWLAVLVRDTKTAKPDGLPAEGAQVAVIMDERDEAGCVLGAVYTEDDAPSDGSSATAFGVTYSDGARYEHDTDSKVGRVTLPDGGALELDGNASKLALENPVKDELTKVKTELSKIQTTLATGVAPPGGGPVTFGSPYTNGYTSVGAVGAAKVSSS